MHVSLDSMRRRESEKTCNLNMTQIVQSSATCRHHWQAHQSNRKKNQFSVTSLRLSLAVFSRKIVDGFEENSFGSDGDAGHFCTWYSPKPCLYGIEAVLVSLFTLMPLLTFFIFLSGISWTYTTHTLHNHATCKCVRICIYTKQRLGGPPASSAKRAHVRIP
jgi:hypothetical protein